MKILGFLPSKTLFYGTLGVAVAFLTAWTAAQPNMEPRILAVYAGLLAALRFLQATAERDANVRTNKEVAQKVQQVTDAVQNGHQQQQQTGWRAPDGPHSPPRGGAL